MYKIFQYNHVLLIFKILYGANIITKIVENKLFLLPSVFRTLGVYRSVSISGVLNGDSDTIGVPLNLF